MYKSAKRSVILRERGRGREGGREGKEGGEGGGGGREGGE